MQARATDVEFYTGGFARVEESSILQRNYLVVQFDPSQKDDYMTMWLYDE